VKLKKRKLLTRFQHRKNKEKALEKAKHTPNDVS
jgi:hypothetical protein